MTSSSMDQNNADGEHIALAVGRPAMEFSRRLGADVTQPLESWRQDYIQRIADIITTDMTPSNLEEAARGVAIWSEDADMHLIDALAQPDRDGSSEVTYTLYMGILTIASLLEVGHKELIPHLIPYIDAISFHKMEIGEDILDRMIVMHAKNDLHGILSTVLYLGNLRNGRALPSPAPDMFYRNLIEGYRDSALGIRTFTEGDRKTTILRISNLAGMCIANALHLVPVGERDSESDWYEDENDAFCLRMPSKQFERDLNSTAVEAYVLSTYDNVQMIGGCLLLVRGEDIEGCHATGSWPHGPDDTKAMVRDAEKQTGIDQKGKRTVH